jgi:hypothetical protein
MKAHSLILETPMAYAFVKRSNTVLARGAIQRNHSLPHNVGHIPKPSASINWSRSTLRTCRLPSTIPAAISKAHHNSTVAASAENDAAAVGVVIVDHGSKKKTSNDMLLEFVDVYK